MERSIEIMDANSFVQLALSHISFEEEAAASANPQTLERLKLEKLKEFLMRSLSFVTNRMSANAKQEVANVAKSGEVLLEIVDVQFFEPRGRFKLLVSTDSVVLEGKQFSCVVPLDNISHISCIPSNCSAKKEGEDFLAVRFQQPVKINGKEVRHILGNLSKSPLKLAVTADGNYRDLESLVVTKVLRQASGVKVVRPQKHLFQTMAQQKDYLRCYKGTQEGAIYPLENGVVFVKPLLFLPAEEIASITAGRGGGAGNTRYVDLKIETSDGREHEFTNIEREELAALQMYVKGYLEARAAAAAAKASKKEGERASSSSSSSSVVDMTSSNSPTAAVNVDDADDDDSDDDDDDYCSDGSSDSSGDDSGSDSGSDGSSSSSESESDDERGAKKKASARTTSKSEKSGERGNSSKAPSSAPKSGKLSARKQGPENKLRKGQKPRIGNGSAGNVVDMTDSTTALKTEALAVEIVVDVSESRPPTAVKRERDAKEVEAVEAPPKKERIEVEL